jgi:hypothetical protein
MAVANEQRPAVSWLSRLAPRRKHTLGGMPPSLLNSRQIPSNSRQPSSKIEDLVYQTGVGDPLVRGDVEILRDTASRPSLRLHAAAKLPLMDPGDGFSTGEWDVGSGISLAKRVGHNAVFADVAYWRFGDPPGLELKDAVAYSAAYGRTMPNGRWSIMASVSG